ncbi:MAG: EamA family transporter [Actinobacteria bacterium]|nr:EamA family transporter [Actinomycetota bacterium]
METKSGAWRWVLLTAVAPISWGATYYVTRHFLPAGSPLWGAALRAFPAALLLLLIARRIPRGAWWWKSLVLGALNFGGFFVLVYVAAQLLPTSVAASVMALAPLVFAGLGWVLLGERPTRWMLGGSVLGIVGVLFVVGAGGTAINGWGVLASVAALLMSSIGSVLTTRWRDDTPVLVTTSWQMLAGGLMLVLTAGLVEGPPPRLDVTGILAFGFLSVVATALAFVCWFTGLRHMSAGSVGIIGLLNPVTGVLLGTVWAMEPLTALQAGGILLVLAGIGVAQRARPVGVRCDSPQCRDPACARRT